MLMLLFSKRSVTALHRWFVLNKRNHVIKEQALHYLSDDTIITVVGLVNNFGSLFALVGKSIVDPLEEMTAPQSIDNRASLISEQDKIISTGANNNTIEPPKHRSLKHTTWKKNKKVLERVQRKNNKQTLPAWNRKAASCR